MNPLAFGSFQHRRMCSFSLSHFFRSKNPRLSSSTWPEGPHALFETLSVLITFHLHLILPPSTFSHFLSILALFCPPAHSFTSSFLSVAINTSCCLSNLVAKLKDSSSPLIPVAERAEKTAEEHWWTRKHPSALNSGLMQTLMGGHRRARPLLCACAKERICITSCRPVFNISELFCVSPLDSTSSSSFLLCWRLGCVFRRLQGSAKLDWVRCNEKHARESYDIKCHTNMPRQTLQSFSPSVCVPPHTHTCNTCYVCELWAFWRMKKAYFGFHCSVFAADCSCTHEFLPPKNWQRESRMKLWSSIDFELSCWWRNSRKQVENLRQRWHEETLTVVYRHTLLCQKHWEN